MSALGDILARGVTLWQVIAGNITTTRKFLRQTGTGAASALPTWDTLVNGDLPDTAVTPGTYGDSTHVGQVTLNQKGVATAASNVAISYPPSGDVTGPGSSTADDFVQFNGTTGKIIKDGGLAKTITVGTPGVDTLIPTEKAVRSAIAAAGGGNVTTAATLTSGKTIVGAGTTAIDVSSLTAQFAGSSSGTLAAASMSTAKLLGRTTAASGAVEEITPGASLKFSSTTLDGRIVQIVNTETGAVATGSTTIPADDTIPQITEGTEFMTLAITPVSTTNKLLIEVKIQLACATTGRVLTAALFQDSTANALAVGVQESNIASGLYQISFSYYMIAGTTISTTFRVRAGVQTSGTVTINGAAGNRLYGGVLVSSITITEITV